MKPPFHLVRTHTSADTVIALSELLRQAKESQIIGVAFAALYKQKEYAVNATGEARRSPTFTRGAVLALDDYLEKLVHKS